METRRPAGQVSRRGQGGRVGPVGRVGLALILVIALDGGTFLRAAETENVNLMVGRSTVIDIGVPIQRVSLTSADVADALVTSSAQLLVHGKTPGTISMFVWDRAGAIRRFDVTVQRDLTRLATQMRDLFPIENVGVTGNGKSIVVTGSVSTKAVAEKVVEVAAGYVEGKGDVVNLLQIQDAGAGARQVLLRVRFAEVSRSAMTELGVSWFTSPTGVKNTVGRITTQQFAAPGFDELKVTKPDSNFGTKPTGAEGKFTFGDFLNLFLFSETFDIGAMVKALQSKGLFQNLAEPNLVAESGKEASFLAGGEFPIPIAQGSGGNLAITVQFKEFGVRLNFTPTVVENRVHLKVRPEVSTLDFSNAVVLQGFRIPALATRRTETELELNDNQTFAIAGLMNNSMTSTLQKIPGIGDIPILGALFKSKAAQKDQTELVVMITPQILPQNSNGVTPNLPRLDQPFLPRPNAQKTLPSPPAAFTSAPGGTSSGDVAAGAAQPAPAKSARTTEPAATDAANAAAIVSALTPKGPTLVQAPSVTPQSTAPSVTPQSTAPSVTPQSTAPSATPQSTAPSVTLQSIGPSATPQSTAPSSTPQPTASSVKSSQTPGPSSIRPEDARALERARKESARATEEQAKRDRAAAKQAAQQAEIKRRKDEQEKERQAELAREQAKHDAEKASQTAKVAARQAEIDKKRQKAIDEAAMRLKAAEASYQAEIAKNAR